MNNWRISEKESESIVETTRESDPDRIRVQIDLTKFDQLEVSDCESLDDPPIGKFPLNFPIVFYYHAALAVHTT